mmetsp:Transcript_5493/g.11249  ORF Transcript_5493/g.11249 Transcript_5493/m.11249 type:complete len:1101 (-) Transcript_5493:2-3304(-)
MSSHSNDAYSNRSGPRSDDEVTASLIGLFAPPPSDTTRSTSTEKVVHAVGGEQADEANGDTAEKVQENNASKESEPCQEPDMAKQSSGAAKASSLQSLFGDPSSDGDKFTDSGPSSFQTLFEDPRYDVDENSPLLSSSSFGSETLTPKVTTGNRKSIQSGSSEPARQQEVFQAMYSQPLAPIEESERHRPPPIVIPSTKEITDSCGSTMRLIFNECTKSSTWIGSAMFLLYHCVFCLTMGSAITAPYRKRSMLGLFTKMAALGVMTSSSVYWINLKGASELPAMYPTVDLFTAPFLASIAVLVDEHLHNDPNVGPDDDDVFLASFTFLSCLAILLSGSLTLLAGVFKLANLGSFLPFPVLAGFFAAVGVMMWTLAFKIDTQMPIGHVLFSGDMSVIKYAFMHHAPTFILAGLMKLLGKLNPLFVTGLIVSSVAVVYMVMYAFDVSMEKAIENKWFWSQSDLVYEGINAKVGFQMWAPPAPFGLWNWMFRGKIHWGAVVSGLEPTLALSFLYLIRCSIHAAALRKNVTTLSRTEKIGTDDLDESFSSMTSGKMRRPSLGKESNPHARMFSEVIDLEHILTSPSDGDATPAAEPTTEVVNHKPTSLPMKDVLLEYGHSQFISALIGSFGVVPSVAASSTMYMLRAEKMAPQIGSCVLVFFFYMTDFQVVGYIPKLAFSSLIVLAFMDMMDSWLIKSYFRTKEKTEWLVVPIIVVFAFVVGLLNAVFLGVAMSTFIFVAAFFRSGVVKYLSNGLSVRSTIERPPNAAEWLDKNGELIQILILQNYLFFGNSSSILAYISSMFEDPDPSIDPVFVPPIPKVIVMDLTLVTGMDTSSVDVFGDILTLCKANKCKLFLAGVNRDLVKTMSLNGFKADTAKVRSKRKLRFFSDLDNAVGKAEDMLLQQEGFEEKVTAPWHGRRGFEYALEQIDKQHSMSFAKDLKRLSQFTKKIVLQPGQVLYEDIELDRGLFFIEHGIVKVERNADETITRKGNGDTFSRTATNSWGSLNYLKAAEVTRVIAEMKAKGNKSWDRQSFRVARVGPGWVLGQSEALGDVPNPAEFIAVSKCELHYISYEKLEEIEKTDPVLVLTLYKLLASLMAKDNL